jgi:hypothetical protein
MVRSSKRVNRFFGEQSGQAAHVAVMKRMLANRLRSDRELVEPGNFEKFRRVLSNELQITELRPVRVENPQVELAQLFSELVDVNEHREPAPRPAAFERLDELFLSDRFAPLIQRDVTIHVPVLEREIEVPYAYQNGRLNLIQTQCFHQKSESAIIREACNTAVQGNLLSKHPLPGLGKCHLVVFASFGDADEEVRQRIGTMLSEHHVDFYREDTMGSLADRILTTAHR